MTVVAQADNHAKVPLGHIEAIQYLRGIAALAVALAHVASLQKTMAPDVTPLLPEFSGFWGVDIFFVISGFIIVYITQRTEPGAGEAAVFMLKRIVRIVPAYWCFTLLVYFADTRHWFSDEPTKTNMALLLKSLFFVKPGFPLLFVGWTLTLEMFFYAIFALCMWRTPHGFRVWLVAGVFCLLTAMPLLFNVSGRYEVFYTQAILLEFVAGMLIGYFYGRTQQRLSGKPGAAVLLSGWILLLLITTSLPEHVLVPQRALWWGLPAVLIVFGALHVCMVQSRILSGLGSISYSLYLCHMPCAYLGALVARHFSVGAADILWLYLAVTLPMTLLVSMVSWWLLERWPQAALRRGLERSA